MKQGHRTRTNAVSLARNPLDCRSFPETVASVSPHDRRPIRAETRATLVAAIAHGRRWLDEIVAGTVTSVEQIAARDKCSVRQVNMTISLAFLAPSSCRLPSRGDCLAGSASRVCAMLLPSGPANTRCSVCRSVFIHNSGRRQERVWRAQRLQAKICAIAPTTGGRDRTSHIRTRENARKLRAIWQRPENAGSHRTAWWGWKDSNLQPDCYELTSSAARRANFSGLRK
jgi:hypothetical protein